MNIPWLPKFCVTLGAKALWEGDRMPWYMGTAWYLPYSNRVVCMPIPLNLVAGLVRSVWLRARRNEMRDELFNLYRYGHHRGWRAGESHGYSKGLRHGSFTRQ